MTRKPVFFLARQSAQKTQGKYPRKSTRRRAAAGSGIGAQWVRQRRRKGSTLRSTLRRWFEMSESLQSTTTKAKRAWSEKQWKRGETLRGREPDADPKFNAKAWKNKYRGRKGWIEKNSGEEAKAKEPRKREQFQNAMHAL